MSTLVGELGKRNSELALRTSPAGWLRKSRGKWPSVESYGVLPCLRGYSVRGAFLAV
jgi:hypothetical protein